MDSQRLLRLREVSEQMLVSALNSDWDALDHLQDEQSGLAREIFIDVSECSAHERAEVSSIITILAQVVRLAEQGRTEVAEQIKQLKKSSVVQNAYLQNAE